MCLVCTCAVFEFSTGLRFSIQQLDGGFVVSHTLAGYVGHVWAPAFITRDSSQISVVFFYRLFTLVFWDFQRRSSGENRDIYFVSWPLLATVRLTTV